MTSYRVYWLDQRHRIQRGAWIEAEDDDAAKLKAADLCDGEAFSIEVWQGPRPVDEVQCHDAA